MWVARGRRHSVLCQVELIKFSKKQCHNLSKLALVEDSGIPSLPLVLIQGGLGAAGSADVPDFRLVFVLLTLHNPVQQTFLRLQCRGVEQVCAGSEIELDFRLEHFESEVGIALGAVTGALGPQVL